ncbi:hypothetical protein J31TS4_02020 [Paenibacillus sp. J31TS4]|uniref:phosphotransferase enzyme family protein n=1 Tax=Paenibacillus sp. J31TS4 TaxID=2807195 RepID=UPI001B22E302|nr:phosphotransferase [Paenibacillus sp. J31TS4]GIP36922.1 hypothetical protein J31TS4_02020 [Paenibacillus sp. J31TS4]
MLQLAINHSVISSESLRSFLMNRYDIGQVSECRFLSNGLNDTYRVTTPEESYIYRIYKVNWRTPGDVAFEIDLLDHLHNEGIPVSYAVRKRDGQAVTEIASPEGIRFCVLFTYAPGQPSNDDASCRLYGIETARMHEAMDKFPVRHDRFAIDLDHLLKEPIGPIRRLLSHREEDMAYLEALAERLRQHIGDQAEKLDWGVCHGDLHGGNVHFHNEALIHIDFDCGGNGYRAYDLSVFLWAKVRGREKDAFRNEKWELFLEGYRSVRELVKEDWEAITAFVAIREIWLMGLHTSYSHIWGEWQDDAYFDRSLRFLRSWCEAHALA